MHDINLESILSRIPPSSSSIKTASENEAGKGRDEVAEARKNVENAVANAQEENTPCQSKVATEKVAAADKLANELLDADTDSMLKLARVMGGAFEEGRLGQASIHAQAAQALEAETAMPKTAEEAQHQGYIDGVKSIGSVIDAADAGYVNVVNNVEKLAADIEERGYVQADILIKKAQETMQQRA